jgi:hypothetical protein
MLAALQYTPALAAVPGAEIGHEITILFRQYSSPEPGDFYSSYQIELPKLSPAEIGWGWLKKYLNEANNRLLVLLLNL